MLPPFDIPAGSFTLVTDELAAPADFVVHQVVYAQIKEEQLNSKGRVTRAEGEEVNARVLVLSASWDEARWRGVASKFNVSLPVHIASGVVKFIDIPTSCASSGGSEPPRLSSVFETVSRCLSGSSDGKGKLVILDDVSTLEWIGFAPLDVIRFVRAVRVACYKSGATLLVRYHITAPGEVDDQLAQLLEMCTYHLDVRPLYSGRSGAVTGEIALHRGAAARQDDVKLIRRSGSLQYRLLDTGPVYFQKGTSEGVL